MLQIQTDAAVATRHAFALLEQDIASRDYPSVVITGQRLHTFYNTELGWQVWLNAEDRDFTGCCIAVGETREAAEAEAATVLASVLGELALRMPQASQHGGGIR